MESVYRILMINTEDGTWDCIRGEAPVHEKITSDVLIEYASEKIHNKDRARFISFLYKNFGDIPKGVEKIFYNRNCGQAGWRFCCLEVFELNDPIMLLVVRDVEYDVDLFLKQIKD